MTEPINYSVDPDFNDLLEESYEMIANKCDLRLINDEALLTSVQTMIINCFGYTYPKQFMIINLFEITYHSKQHYIVQGMLEEAYPRNPKDGDTHSITKKTYYHLGIFKSDDIGNTIMRPETFADKMIPKAWDKDIDFESNKTFSKKYYLVSDSKEAVLSSFNDTLVDELSNQNDLMLIAHGKEWIFFFDNDFKVEQSAILLSILRCIN